jgi:hypothetical protein
VMLLASDRQQLIGYVSVLGENFRRHAHCGRLNISIKSKYHRCCVGSLLMREVIRWASYTDWIKRLELEVFEISTVKNFFVGMVLGKKRLGRGGSIQQCLG